eukprot:TRINITY_DN2438_c0_g1_i1.p1 TRINITY_DN2438_c0_g1~~TRINITY_DN2438_c0_g1_i1.p1  ORF type:complete len:469 (-),score=118.22 TRINITY_DN2438_c0_g1_i1:106-1512(-)
MKVAAVLLVLLASFYLSDALGTSDGAVLFENDIKVLQTAQFSEEGSAALYDAFLTRWDFSLFQIIEYTAEQYTKFLYLQQQHKRQAKLIKDTLESLRPGSSLPACTYNWPFNDPREALELASQLANSSVGSFDLLIRYSTNQEVAALLYHISTNNARESAYWETIWHRNPFPLAFEQIEDPSSLLARWSRWSNCPFSDATLIPSDYFYQPPSTTPAPSFQNGVYRRSIIPSAAQLSANNRNLNRYLHTVERLAVTFYGYVLNRFTAANFRAAGYSNTDYLYLGYINQHHIASAQTFSTLSGSNAYPVCTYTIPQYATLQEYFALAQRIEDLAVSIHGGSLSFYHDENLQLLVATIGSVEARHSTWLRVVNNQNPFTESTPLYSPTEGVQLISQFQRCPFEYVIPDRFVYPPGDLFPRSSTAAAPVSSSFVSQTRYYETGESLIGCTAAPTTYPPSNDHTLNINLHDLF